VQYNGIFGSRNIFYAKGSVQYNGIFGYRNVYSATGNVMRNGIFGSYNIHAAIGSVQDNGIFGYRNVYSATGDVEYNGIFGYQNAYSAVNSVQDNGIFGYQNAYSATGNVMRNGIFGEQNAYHATNVYDNGIFGLFNAISATGNIYNSLLVGASNADSATTVINTIAVGGDVYRNSKIDLTNSIGIGYQAGMNTTYTNTALFGVKAQPTQNDQVVIGSSEYADVLITPNVTISNNLTVEDTLSVNFINVDTIVTVVKVNSYDYYEAGEAISQWDVCYMNSNGKMYVANADTSITAYGLVMIATSNLTSGSSGYFFDEGEITGQVGLTPGTDYFLSATTDGDLVTTAPKDSGDQVWYIGTANSTTSIRVNIEFISEYGSSN